MPDAVEIKKGHESACVRIDEIKDELLAQLIKAREEMESE
jgi:hypothetical protein